MQLRSCWMHERANVHALPFLSHEGLHVLCACSPLMIMCMHVLRSCCSVPESPSLIGSDVHMGVRACMHLLCHA